MIKIYPLHGLCNRMRAIDSALSLSKKTNRKLEIYWEQNKGLNTSFLDLFNPIKDTEIIEVKKLPFLFKQGTKRNLFLPALVRKGLNSVFYDAVKTKKLGDQNHTFSELNSYRTIWIKSFTRFFENSDMYKSFQPVPNIQRQIESETRLFNKSTIGIHIRRTDNKKSILNSPLNLFIAEMSEEVKKEPKTRFYLASDDLNVKTQLLSLFGERIITNCDDVNRDTKQGMERAVVELYSLSKTQKVFGSLWSSFSHTACHIGGIEEITIKI